MADLLYVSDVLPYRAGLAAPAMAAAAGVGLAGEQLSAVCRLDLHGAWRLLATFEAPDRCILLVAEHTRSACALNMIGTFPDSRSAA